MDETKKSRRKLKRVIAIRHGSDNGRDLDELGCVDMLALANVIKARWVKPEHIVEIFSSPLPRAAQSSDISSFLVYRKVSKILK